MLPPDYLERIAEGIIALYEELNLSIVRDAARRLVTAGTMTESARFQIELLQQSGMLYQEIIRRIAFLSGQSEKAVRQLSQEAAVRSMEYDSQVYRNAGLKPVPLKPSPSLLNILTAGLQKTNGFLHNLTLTTANAFQQAYIKAANLAYTQVATGDKDYVTAIREAVKTASQAGTSVVYPTGHCDKLDVAVRRAVLTGVNQTTLKLTESYAREMGCSLVETTAHAGARPTHEVWQGKVFSLDGKNPDYPDFVSSTGYGTGAGLGGWNCRHSFHPFFEGSAPLYTPEELAKMNEKSIRYQGQEMTLYEATQKQRAMERSIRESKRELAGLEEAAKAADSNSLKRGLQADFNAASAKLKQREAALKDFLSQTGLVRDAAREQAQSFGRSQSQKAVWAAKKSSALEKFTNPGYTGSQKRGVPVEKDILFQKIDETVSYSSEYKSKMKEAYSFFSERGYLFREHALNRFLGQKSGRGKFEFSQEDLLSILCKEYNYEQPDGKRVRFYQGIAVISAPDTDEVVGIVVRGKPKNDWRDYHVKK